jgi:hypothetical protein
MKRVILTASALLLASAGSAYAATPGAITKLADCCAQVLACCGVGGCC